MARILYTNGCSWAVGAGINKDPGMLAPIKYAWPQLLSDRLGCKVINDAMGGGSNARILRTTCDFILNYPPSDYKNLTVIIGWTTCERDEIFIQHGGTRAWYMFNAMQPFTQCHLGEIDIDIRNDIAYYQRIYIMNMYNHQVNLAKYIQQKLLLSNLLENLGIEYIFFNSIPPSFDPVDMDEYTTKLDKIKNNKFIEFTFNEYLYNKNIKLSSCSHPPKEGHIVWADYLYDKLHT